MATFRKEEGHLNTLHCSHIPNPRVVDARKDAYDTGKRNAQETRMVERSGKPHAPSNIQTTAVAAFAWRCITLKK